jgi:DNA-binding transcriptional LysR family regulator
MDRLHAMHLFVRVAELGSFSAVAQQLAVDRSVVTRQIAALESHLGIKLMARSTRRLTLTSSGTAYLEQCRVILNLVEVAETGIAEERQTPRGAIRISVPLSFGLQKLTPLLLAFADRYPDVRLEMDYTDRRVHLIEEGFDLSIRITSRLESSDVVRKIGSSRMLLIASPDYLARYGNPQHPSELTQHACLGYASAGNQQSWQFEVDGAPLTMPVRARLSANNGEMLTEAAAKGLGITCQPDFIADAHLAAGRVRQILAAYPMPELGIYVMLPGNRQIPHRVRVMMDFLAASFVASEA